MTATAETPTTAETIITAGKQKRPGSNKIAESTAK
jgi:hypothetical protein